MGDIEDPTSLKEEKMSLDTRSVPESVPQIHAYIEAHRKRKAVKVADQTPPNLNGRIALVLTRAVGTMWCAYAFALLALVALPQAFGSPLTLIQWISQTFIQLVMLSVIMVGQNLLSAASDKRAEDTWNDADATFHTARHIQEHLRVQDKHLNDQDARLEQIVAALSAAFPAAKEQLQGAGGSDASPST
jgi:hypothetical protein